MMLRSLGYPTAHLMSVLIASRLIAIPERDLTLAEQGGVTRIAGSDPALWEQIVGANSDAVQETWRQDQLGLLIKAVEATPATDDLRRSTGARRRDTQDRGQAWGCGDPLQRGRRCDG